MKRILILTMALLSLFSLSHADTEKHFQEISGKDRGRAALTALKSNPNTVQVYARGLVCESCAIGIRKKLQKLKFVDNDKPDKGIVLDVKRQLVSVFLKEGKRVDSSAIIKAVKGAGYDPVTLYELEGGKKLKSTSLEN